MRLNASRDEPKSSNKQHEHHDRIEQAHGSEIDMQIGDYSGKDEECACDGKNPPSDASAAPKQKTDAKKHWEQRNPKSIFAMECPVRAHYRNLVD
jgi:hypothetical protein